MLIVPGIKGQLQISSYKELKHRKDWEKKMPVIFQKEYLKRPDLSRKILYGITQHPFILIRPVSMKNMCFYFKIIIKR
jgi:hypothetical protein